MRSALPSRALRSDINRLAEMRAGMMTADTTTLQAAAELAIDVHGRGLGGRHRERVSRRALYALSTAALRNAPEPLAPNAVPENSYNFVEPAPMADTVAAVGVAESMPQPVLVEAA